jgi:AcrR family transcriptional regulator
MGRPKNFSREGVLKEALSVFWKHGFADTSLQELERATGVNKSGLYSEFEDKEDLFVQSLQYYLEMQQKRGLLTAEPLGWNNVERFLKLGLYNKKEQKGCFSISSMREFPILPPKVLEIVTQSRQELKELIARNIEVEKPKMTPHSLAELVLTFFTGLCMEQYGKSSRTDLVRKVDNLMKALRGM